MILGIGSDIADIRRFEKALETYGERFAKRILTPAEIKQAESKTAKRHSPMAARMAKYFAAKEAAMKAINAGKTAGISWQDMEISYDNKGKPQLTLKGRMLELMQSKMMKHQHAHIHVSLSDDYPSALAFVVIDLREGALH